MVSIQLNGETYAYEGAATLDALIASLQLDSEQVAVEKNRTIVPRSQYAQEAVAAGDAIEIIEFVGGG